MSERAATPGRARYPRRPSRAGIAAWHRRSGPALRHRRDAAARRPVAADVAGADRRDRTARLSRRRHQPRGSARHHADAHRGRDRGDPARDHPWRRCLGGGNCQRAASDAPAHRADRRRIPRGRRDFDRLHKGFHTALLAACGSKTPAARAFRSLRPGLSLSPRDDALLRQRQEIRRARISCSPTASSRATSPVRRRCWQSHLRSTLDFVYPAGNES